MDTLVYFFQQEKYRAAIKRKNWQCKLLLTDLEKLIFNIQLFYEVDYHGDRCTYGIISLSVYPDLCDARWIIVSDTNVVPDIWSNWWWARLDTPTLVISINTTPYYPKPKSISPVDKHWPFIILSVHPQKNSYWIAYVQAKIRLPKLWRYTFGRNRHFGFITKGLTHDFCPKIGKFFSSFFLKICFKMILVIFFI